MPNQVTEEQIAAITVAPRVTKEQVENYIKRKYFFTDAEGIKGATLLGQKTNVPRAAMGLTTFCVLVLQNDFTIVGESVCTSRENYNRDIGERLAQEKAISKVWEFLGFQLRTNLAMIEEAGIPTGAITKLGKPVYTYTGTKVVHAIPMSRGEYNRMRNWQLPLDQNPDDEGYLVEYISGEVVVLGFSGYISWTPKEVFERNYCVGITIRETSFMERLVTEFENLEHKLGKLLLFTGSSNYRDLDKAAQQDLTDQAIAMKQYLDILERRIRNMSGIMDGTA